MRNETNTAEQVIVEKTSRKAGIAASIRKVNSAFRGHFEVAPKWGSRLVDCTERAVSVSEKLAGLADKYLPAARVLASLEAQLPEIISGGMERAGREVGASLEAISDGWRKEFRESKLVSELSSLPKAWSRAAGYAMSVYGSILESDDSKVVMEKMGKIMAAYSDLLQSPEYGNLMASYGTLIKSFGREVRNENR